MFWWRLTLLMLLLVPPAFFAADIEKVGLWTWLRDGWKQPDLKWFGWYFPRGWKTIGPLLYLALISGIGIAIIFGSQLAEFQSYGQEVDAKTNNVPYREYRVVLEKAEAIETRRASAAYTFSVKQTVKGEPSSSLHIGFFQGADRDGSGPDAIGRLGNFFKIGPATWRESDDPTMRPMTIGNTNIVSLRMFGPVWLFENKDELAVAIDVERFAPEGRSTKFMEEFARTNRNQRVSGSTNQSSSPTSLKR
jgi:hypothetical protein